MSLQNGVLAWSLPRTTRVVVVDGIEGGTVVVLPDAVLSPDPLLQAVRLRRAATPAVTTSRRMWLNLAAVPVLPPTSRRWSRSGADRRSRSQSPTVRPSPGTCRRHEDRGSAMSSAPDNGSRAANMVTARRHFDEVLNLGHLH